MSLSLINPASDPRWDDLVARHPRASVFHSRGWLQSLARTYRYEPLALTSGPPGEALQDGIVFCRVSSWITGTRLVSLPFADHCDPLLNEMGAFGEFATWLKAQCDGQGWKYIELRPLSGLQDASCGMRPSSVYWFHELDLTPSSEQIFRALHKDSIQRKIQRADKEQLSYEAGRSQQLIDEFYRLLLITRRRHQLLPQPRIWFRNLVECMGNSIQIRVARKDGTAIAAMLTLRHGATVVYKYGCSNEKFHALGGMPFLFWNLIEESKALGAQLLDFGRSDLGNEGLMTFKDRFGTTRKSLTYYRYSNPRGGKTADWNLQAIRHLFSILPDAVSSRAGGIVYRHLG